MTFTATFCTDRCLIKTAVVEAASETEARKAAAKIFGIRAHLFRIHLKQEIENDYSGDNSWA